MNAEANTRLVNLHAYCRERIDVLARTTSRKTSSCGTTECNSNGDHNDDNKECENSSLVGDAVRATFDRLAGTGIAGTNAKLKGALEDLDRQTDDLKAQMERAARSANAATPGQVTEWGRLHWGICTCIRRFNDVNSCFHRPSCRISSRAASVSHFDFKALIRLSSRIDLSSMGIDRE